MAGIEEFLKLLDEDIDDAFKKYFFNVDAKSLDGDETVKQDCRVQKVCFEFVEPNRILMRDPGGNPTKYQDEIWYLPWVRDGATKANLGGDGPPFFSTSQLDGCRFTIQYHDTSRKNVTVLHLAGNVGHQSSGSEKRNKMETEQGVKTNLAPKLTRRYSISKGKKGVFEKVGQDFSLKYDGDKAMIFGFRDADGSWDFYAQQMMGSGSVDEPPFGKAAKGLRELTAL
jgi:hypothetical protein